MIRSLALQLAARFRHNHNLVRFSSSASASASASASTLHHATPSSSSAEPVHITQNCVRRMKELEANESSTDGKVLRLSVETGGCSGFQYVFNLEDRINSDDRVFEKEGIKLVVDNLSYDFVKGATVDYVEELIRSAFVVTENPSAVGGCSCKSSFMVKQ
ncbi:iron-sulfur assembly protein IscA-like 2, mitochondrial [Cajanus cajan]|uniref:Core domain-containing protein n=1 Tax=Cajanus cajan TaxID=3821 RepID=A0A151SRI7_CAJCA|nr:iron-sulfur assembly protein IscA-like 2, mitochondrial [Cajanus cajan]KYP57378.1 hypothetical protein KK1_003639 [Cajanus cajan]